MDRVYSVSSDGRSSCLSVLRRASSESQIPDQHRAPQKYDVYVKHAQKGRADGGVSNPLVFAFLVYHLLGEEIAHVRLLLLIPIVE